MQCRTGALICPAQWGKPLIFQIFWFSFEEFVSSPLRRLKIVAVCNAFFPTAWDLGKASDQLKTCYIHRFISDGTMEEKIFCRQVAKLSMSLRVLDKKTIESQFTLFYMDDLCVYTPDTLNIHKVSCLVELKESLPLVSLSFLKQKTKYVVFVWCS